MTLIRMPPVKNIAKYIIAMEEAFLITDPSRRLPKAPGFSCFRKVAMALNTKTARVVVFIPPAVEPGEPPISIRKIMMALEDSVIAVKSAVLKPAVLGVTA